jgi:hypothetical protein
MMTAAATAINETTAASLMAAFQVFRLSSTSSFIVPLMSEIPRRYSSTRSCHVTAAFDIEPRGTT